MTFVVDDLFRLASPKTIDLVITIQREYLKINAIQILAIELPQSISLVVIEVDIDVEHETVDPRRNIVLF